MKKILTSILLLSLVLTSCHEKGTVTTAPHDFIIIHGKTYKLMSVVPCYSCHPIWIMYPKDSTQPMPTIINYDVQNGKTTSNESIIKVD